MHSDHIKLPKDPAAEAIRAAVFERKQRWKELPGNRYTPDELRHRVGEFGDFTVLRPKRRVMFIH